MKSRVYEISYWSLSEYWYLTTNRGRESERAETKIWKERKENIKQFKSIEAENKDLQEIRRRKMTRRKFAFDGIAEHENELWSDTEKLLKNVLYKMLNTQRVGKEWTHMIRKPKYDSPRTIFAKLSSHKFK